jgi:hypothetical protein
MARVELERLPDDVGLMRVLRHVPPLFKVPDYQRPTWRAFRPTDDDAAEGARRGREAGLSVFDDVRCSPPLAVDVRDELELRNRGRALGPASVYAATAATLQGAAGRPSIAAFHDPLADPQEPTRLWDRAGANAHAVIEGLDAADDKARESRDYKDLLTRVALATKRVFDRE